MASIRAEGVGVRFLFDRAGRLLTPTLARLRKVGLETWGLRGVTCELRPGDGVALLGRSGAGKTTLLRVLADIYVPDEGTVGREGHLGSLLSIGAGVTGALTGRENAELLGVLGGLSRAESRRRLDQVRGTSGVGDAFDRPVSSWSQGMRARLGFAAADEARPQILLLDEVHEALDHEFRAVVERRAAEILGSGGIVVAAGHDHPLLERLCTRALWLDSGRLVADGPFAATQAAYFDAA